MHILGGVDQNVTIPEICTGSGSQIHFHRRHFLRGQWCWVQAVRRVVGRMHAREQEVSNAQAETSTFVMHHLQVSPIPPDFFSKAPDRRRNTSHAVSKCTIQI